MLHRAFLENRSVQNDWTPLFEACESENIVAVKCLLENHANPNVQNQFGLTALHLICSLTSKRALQIIQLLLEHNADIGAVNIGGETPLFVACVYGNIAAVKCLLENHANPNVRNRKGETSLHCIRYYHSTTTRQIIQLLLKHEADIDAEDENGWTPLMKVCNSGNIGAVKWLLKNHANPNVTDRHGQTALHCLQSLRWTSETPDHRIYLDDAITTRQKIQLLLKHNADIEAVDENGWTPLFKACNSGYIGVVEGLLRYGANINILDKRNQSPLQCAVDKMSHFLPFPPLYTNTYMIIKMLVSQIIKLKTVGLNANACEFITINGVEYSAIEGLKSNGVLDDTIDTLNIKCEEEIERMKMERIGINNMFFYDLLTQHIHVLGILMENKKIRNILKSSIYDKKFPLYIGIIRFRLRDAQIQYRQYKLKKSVREYFSSFPNF